MNQLSIAITSPMNRRRFLQTTALAPLVLSGCTAFNQKVIDPLITTLSKIANTALVDLQQAAKVALAANPPDMDGYNAIQAVITVLGQVQKVVAAAQSPNSGVFTTAELASLFQPGSAQYNAAQQTLVSGCAAKAQDVLGAAGVLAAGGVIGALAGGQVLPLLAAAA